MIDVGGRVSGYREITFTDELLSGGGVYRRFSDGDEEWRWRDPDGTVWWRDNRGRHGTDEPLRGAVVKRMHVDGQVRYGRDLGFGWTLWNDGVVTLNLTKVPEGLGTLLARVGARALLGALPPPPSFLDPAQEQKLRPAGTGRDDEVGRARSVDADWASIAADADGGPDDFG